MNANKALWEKGDFTRIAETMRESGDQLVERLGITPGMKVLDLGCGDGTTAIPAARRGAEVRGVDIASNLVEAGNRRARELGLANCRFEEGDACDLRNVEDGSVDLLISIFGAMFAPNPCEDKGRGQVLHCSMQMPCRRALQYVEMQDLQVLDSKHPFRQSVVSGR